jgi:hypothetical protein
MSSFGTPQKLRLQSLGHAEGSPITESVYTQLYLDDDIWKALHVHSRQRRTSVSGLVRQAVRDRYGSSPANRRQAMMALVACGKTAMTCPMQRPTSVGSAEGSGSRESHLEIRFD